MDLYIHRVRLLRESERAAETFSLPSSRLFVAEATACVERRVESKRFLEEAVWSEREVLLRMMPRRIDFPFAGVFSFFLYSSCAQGFG